VCAGNLALLKDNGRELHEADVPLEYLALTPMKLTPEASAILQKEFSTVPESLQTDLTVHGHLLHIKQPPAELLMQPNERNDHIVCDS
jgi:hypothetical protein